MYSACHFSLPKDQLVYIGLRDIDPYEAFILNKVGIRYYAMDVSTQRVNTLVVYFHFMQNG